jgi:hypothetical protein
MALLTTLGADLVLAFLLLFSVQVAAGWGELCGIRPGRDKSGLGGFVALYMLGLIRWLGLTAGLAVVARGDEWAWLLGGHAVLGVVSLQLFGRELARVQNDRFASAAVGLFASTALPLPAWTLVVQRANAAWLGESVVAIAAVALAIGAAHFACFRQRRRSMGR